MYELPVTVEVCGQSFAIRNRGDYRMVLDCFTVLEDIELTKVERVYACLLIFFDGMETVLDLTRLGNLEEAVKKMFNFFNCGKPDGIGHKARFKLIDWEQDSQMICSAVNKVYGGEIRSVEYIHWWTFMGYFLAVGESSLSTVVGIRHKIIDGRPLDKGERRFRNDNPEYFVWSARDVKQREDDELLKQLWNQEG